MKKYVFFMLLLIMTTIVSAVDTLDGIGENELKELYGMNSAELMGFNQQIYNPGLNIPGLGLGAMLLALLIFGAVYVYFSWSFMDAGKRLEVPDAGYAWIPSVGKLLVMFKMAKMPWWPLVAYFWAYILGVAITLKMPIFGGFLTMICFLAFAIYLIIVLWKICENLKKPGWWAIVSLVLVTLGTIVVFFQQIIGSILFLAGLIWFFVMWGILAWEK